MTQIALLELLSKSGMREKIINDKYTITEHQSNLIRMKQICFASDRHTD